MDTTAEETQPLSTGMKVAYGLVGLFVLVLVILIIMYLVCMYKKKDGDPDCQFGSSVRAWFKEDPVEEKEKEKGAFIGYGTAGQNRGNLFTSPHGESFSSGLNRNKMMGESLPEENVGEWLADKYRYDQSRSGAPYSSPSCPRYVNKRECSEGWSNRAASELLALQALQTYPVPSIPERSNLETLLTYASDAVVSKYDTDRPEYTSHQDAPKSSIDKELSAAIEDTESSVGRMRALRDIIKQKY